jgi:hypothetical protein
LGESENEPYTVNYFTFLLETLEILQSYNLVK